MRDKTREAMRLFLGGRCYTAEKLEKDYLAEVANYSNDRWEAPQRASRLAASVKRYKTSEMLRFIFATIAYDPDPDLTPLTVRRLCKALFGRTGSQWLVVEVFWGEGASAPQRGQQSGDGGKNGCQISSCRRTTLVRNAGRN
ncbi:YadA [Salmonella enterica subsp. enterica]|uniref:YadA n=1 Tax=Salmonella enterica I TaxID=59201 RepID=A0A380CCA3_SALET|nr:YadA [Salmonella enterica subsp. enterica]